jgi:sugar O-acyltransferase (sialic acid O-acetyltransferase NeuD family)
VPHQQPWKSFEDQRENVILQGGGEHARVVLDCLLAEGVNVLGLFDPKYSGALFGVPQRGVYDPGFAPEAKALVAIGDNVVRKKVVEKTRHAFTNTVHPSVVFSAFATLGTGNMILHGAIVQAQARIGNHVIVNTRASVDHDNDIGDFVHLAPGVVLCGAVKVGEGTLVGASATVLPGRSIGAWAIIGSGAVVTRDVPDGAVVVGNPARIIRINQQ